MTISAADGRFLSDAVRYAAYLETPEGRLRLDLAFANLRDFLPQERSILRALDLGCGTANLGIRLARLGFHVTLLDPSQPMLDIASRAAQEAGVADGIALQIGDAMQIGDSFEAESFDVVLCHNVLEFVQDPEFVLRSAARVLLRGSGILSVLVRNQSGEVLKKALVDGDLTAAEQTLGADWGDESLYGGRVRLFTAKALRTMMEHASFAVAAERGVRVLLDYLPTKVSRADDYERIFQLERKLGALPDFAALARYTHSIARRGPSIEKAI
jgi:S-adenosylmethionine-dependent methyltransferase